MGTYSASSQGIRGGLLLDYSLFIIYYYFEKSAILLCTAGRATFKKRQFDNEGMRNVLSYRTIFSSNVTCNIRFALKRCQIVATVVSHCAQLCYYV